LLYRGDDGKRHLYSNILEESVDSKFIYDKRATLRATLSTIKQTNHLQWERISLLFIVSYFLII
ncbi:hypothetical protein, partial [Bacteroides caccae]|uniref:hypothetical protein n=1 Tax=Bacteroides caccae TaxID=47678 RepID=UPI001961B781